MWTSSTSRKASLPNSSSRSSSQHSSDVSSVTTSSDMAVTPSMYSGRRYPPALDGRRGTSAPTRTHGPALEGFRRAGAPVVGADDGGGVRQGGQPTRSAVELSGGAS